MRYENITIDDLKNRIQEIEELIAFNKAEGSTTAQDEMASDLKELKEALAEKENKMIKVIVKNNPETAKLEAIGKDGTVYQANKRLSDLKTALRKSKKGDFEIVEKFEVEKPAKKEKAPKKPVADKKTPKKANGYEDRKNYIIANFTDGDLHSKSDKIPAFCKKFDLTLTKAGRNLTFEKTIEKMVAEGIVAFVPHDGKYKKLSWYYTEDHEAAMSPDEDEL